MDDAAGEIRAARRLSAVRSVRSGTTQLARWADPTQLSTDERWERRARAVAALVPETATVLDLGCGDMKLERYLPPSCRYRPLDVLRRDDRTIVVDLNTAPLPRLDADFVVGLGVLEYLHDVPGVLRQLARQVPAGILSYHPLECSIERDRLSLGWVNALNSPELVAILKGSGYQHVENIAYTPSLHFFRIARRLPAA